MPCRSNKTPQCYGGNNDVASDNLIRVGRFLESFTVAQIIVYFKLKGRFGRSASPYTLSSTSNRQREQLRLGLTPRHSENISVCYR